MDMADTQIIFGEEKEIEERESALKKFRAYGSGYEYLLDDAHIDVLHLTDLMILVHQLF